MNLQEHFIHSRAGSYFRNVWLLEAIEDNPTRLAVFLDGESYMNRMDALPDQVWEGWQLLSQR